MKALDLTGQKFNRLTVLKRVENNKYGCSQWLCKCDCGKEKIILGNNLVRNITRSCGCLQRERVIISNQIHNTIHGHCKDKKQSKTYHAWNDIVQRCTNPNSNNYKNYGKRKITICDRWNPKKGGSFKNFFEDVGEIPEGLTIDRINNNKGYDPSNWQLATIYQQSRNKRSNINIPYKGKIWVLNDLAKEHHIHKDTLRYRLKIGLSIEEALTLPIGKGKLK